MEEALDNVVKKFDDTEKSLQRIENQLESDFFKHLQESNPADGTEDKASLLQKLNEVKQDYSDIKKEALELGNLQREMAVAFQQQLLSTVQKLQALTDKEAASACVTQAHTPRVEPVLLDLAISSFEGTGTQPTAPAIQPNSSEAAATALNSLTEQAEIAESLTKKLNNEHT